MMTNRLTGLLSRGVVLSLLALLSLGAQAQTRPAARYNCLSMADDETATEAGGPKNLSPLPARLPAINTKWDADRIYRQAVVLVSFSDMDFSMDDPQARYNRIFNEPGYNESRGPGCVADYFREQSGGLFNLEFDIYGPVKVSTKHNSGNSSGASIFREALQILVDSLDVDYSVYDWNGNGTVNQIIFIYAGYGGNEDGSPLSQGCIWPNTRSFSTVTHNNLKFQNFTASAELWTRGSLCGIGTVCHEFSHSLGLPDIYPTGNSPEYSVVDEWDLMDGGNFSNNGWCPPNYSGLEKMLLGWLTPIELTEGASISDMLPVSEGGPVYQVKKTDSEYYLLENRQWSGWDFRSPGHGLLVFHVDYHLNAWSSNDVNADKNHHYYDLIHADNRSYVDWDEFLDLGPEDSPYLEHHNQYLSLSPYPYVVDGAVVNNELTDQSTPAAQVYAGDGGLMSKPITNISESADGLISFDFMGGYLSTIENSPQTDARRQPAAAYDLQGRPAVGNGVVIQDGKKHIHH